MTTLTETQIIRLKNLLEEFRYLKGKERQDLKTQILAYLAGCLDGLVI